MPHQPDWSETSRLVAFTLTDGAGGGIYVAFNTSHLPRLLKLPVWGGRVWQPLVDTGKVAPYDFLAPDSALSAEDAAAARRSLAMWTADHTYPVLPWSCIVLVSEPEDPASTTMIRRSDASSSSPQQHTTSGPRNPMTWATSLMSGQSQAGASSECLEPAVGGAAEDDDRSSVASLSAWVSGGLLARRRGSDSGYLGAPSAQQGGSPRAANTAANTAGTATFSFAPATAAVAAAATAAAGSASFSFRYRGGGAAAERLHSWGLDYTPCSKHLLGSRRNGP
ncbi:hypothetical protein GPECTOR_320g28 [Gonium pectorale]|uniref:Isoamylase 1-3-like C-terminal domain-containing protein n=1 Tax=Gonium pectorale TaxID=33097 RepID=A0A150FVS3_GONPE|nr:hypothetical protein GPECTOR_320g28 [Gonium pectorale]|eukprot:KXZ41687.1 hypothetical protein GPECTOR_320g28 [Gonium pectorale]